MSDLQIRQPPFTFEGVEFLWNPANLAYSVFANSVSFWVIGFERYLVRIMKDADAHIADPEVRQEARLFMQQEAVHSKMHRRHVKALIDRYPGLQATVDLVVADFDDLYDRRDLRYHLAYAAAVEGTFTPLFSMIMENRETLLGDGDARVASLLLWHFCEEIEHRSSAVMVYDHVVGDPGYKLRVFPSVLKHVDRGGEMLLQHFQAHVPGEAGADHYGSRSARLLGRRANPFATIPVRFRLRGAVRALASIRRNYDHAHQPIPAWVDTWFASYAQGNDMTRFYGTIVDGTTNERVQQPTP
ncbi:MAG TPA: metal-dependent hydrolase [Acidimicrobiales bacterium]|nr:metal-dependent hydrolase [Acidimicrobiales bacterium]